METKSKQPSHAKESHSMMGGFFSGASTGLINTSLMMGIFSGLGFIGHIIAPTVITTAMPIALPAIAMSIVASTLFSGAMGAKKAYDTTHKPAQRGTPVHAPTRSKSKAREHEVEYDTPSHYRSDWAERTGRSNSSSRVQQILETGSKADIDRAAAILEARENEMGASASR